MSPILRIELDDDSARTFQRIRDERGWSDSQTVCEAIRALAAKLNVAVGTRKILGQGEYYSGIGDLATNPRHMEGYGK